MRAFGYWLVRVALFLCVVVALYALGWRHETVVIGAVLLSSGIAFMMFGSQHDFVAGWVNRWYDNRRSGRGGEGG